MNNESKKLGDRYVIEETRVGGYSVVFKAVDEKINRTVAIKTPNELVLSSDENLNKFIEEAKKLAKINHPNVIEVLHFYEVGELDDKCHIVMEWVSKTLSECISENVLTYENKLSIINKVLLGIQHIHKQDIIHSDLKPANIFVSDDYLNVKIGDLGIARNIDEDHTSMATFKYGAPEHYHTDVNLDSRADIYSAGFMFYELLAGEKKFKELFYDIYSDDNNKKQDTRWLNWHLDKNRTFPALSGLGVGVSDKISNVIDKMTAKDLSERYENITEVLRDFEGMDHHVSEHEITPIEIDESKSNLKLWLSLGTILFIFVAAGLILGPAYIGESNKKTEPSVSVDDVVAIAKQAKEAKEAAIIAGAEELTITEYLKGNDLFSKAKVAYDNGENEEPLSLFTQSRDKYLRSENLAYKHRYNEKINVINDLESKVQAYKLDSSMQPLSNAMSLLNKANMHFKNDQLKESVTNLDEIASLLKKSLHVMPRTITSGSTQQQIEAALVLCKQFDDACSSEWYESEALKEVKVSPFEIDIHEVTREQFQKFIEVTKYKTDAEKNGYSYAWNGTESVKEAGLNWFTDNESLDKNLPVTHMSFNDAQKYCQWNNARLPTEAEWEYAAKGISGNVFPWGNEWDANKIYWSHEGSGKVRLQKVKNYQASVSGSKGYDFSGSVWEWVTKDGNPDAGLLKGGSFLETNPANLRISTQRINDLSVSNNDDGFRCIRSAQQWPESYN